MLPTQNGAVRLFRFSGVQVYLHWTWFVVALVEFNVRRREYSSPVWNALEYLSLFAIVLLHEFGHALACRQTGGKADTIVLWPLGGVAYVRPPDRPGATLWAIAAGPLVNLVLLPISFGLVLMARVLGWESTLPNLYHYVETLATINLVLLVFNMLPIYPLDGGQILRSLLWFWLGRANSLLAASIIGFVGVAVLVVLVLATGALGFNPGSLLGWLLIAFMLLHCLRGFQQAQAWRKFESAPVRLDAACPVCRTPPKVGAFWVCERCRTPFDTFASGAVCPRCRESFPVTSCPACGAIRPIQEWVQHSSSSPPPLPT